MEREPERLRNSQRHRSGVELGLHRAGVEWSVTGTSYFNGQFNVTANNPVAEEFCTTWFSYFGYIEQPGCNTGSGNWSNGSSQAGFWSWSKPCEVPSGETTHFDGWHPSFPTLANFSMTLSGARMWGRTVTEGVGPGGSGDSCWFAQSQFPPQTTITGGTWVADAAQAWGADSVGWAPQLITYYRGQNRAPCGFSWGQRMYIACAESPDPSYKDNILVATIGVSTITVSRDGVSATKTY